MSPRLWVNPVYDVAFELCKAHSPPRSMWPCLHGPNVFCCVPRGSSAEEEALFLDCAPLRLRMAVASRLCQVVTCITTSNKTHLVSPSAICIIEAMLSMKLLHGEQFVWRDNPKLVRPCMSSI